GRLGHPVDAGDVQFLEGVEVVRGHALGQVLHGRVQLPRPDNQLVVHVGDVDDEGDLVAQVGEVALDRVEDDRTDHVPDVAGLVDGRAAQVDPALLGLDGPELLLLSAQGAVDAQLHGAWSPLFGVPFDQRDDLAGDGLGPADVADALAGLGLDVDPADVHA